MDLLGGRNSIEARLMSGTGGLAKSTIAKQTAAQQRRATKTSIESRSMFLVWGGSGCRQRIACGEADKRMLPQPDEV
jgi:hypothetical protein